MSVGKPPYSRTKTVFLPLSVKRSAKTSPAVPPSHLVSENPDRCNAGISLASNDDEVVLRLDRLSIWWWTFPWNVGSCDDGRECKSRGQDTRKQIKTPHGCTCAGVTRAE